MRVKINIVKEKDELAVINTSRLSDEILEAKALLENKKDTILGVLNGVSYQIDINKIYYIESVDNKTFVSTKTETYESKLKLYEISSYINRISFVRISKQMICNVKKIKHVKSSLNGRMNATLLNDEVVVINRMYVKDLKKAINIGGIRWRRKEKKY